MTSETAQDWLVKSIGLHVGPGVMLTAAFFLLRPLVVGIGYPPLLAFILAVLLVDIPVQLGILYVKGRRLNGRYSLDGVVPRETSS